MNIKKQIALGGATLLTPFIAFAAEKGIAGVIETVSGLISMIVPVVMALAVLYFFIGLVKFMMKAGKERDDARDQMIWGIVILFVMVSVWGLVNLLKETFGVESTGTSIENPVDVIK